MTNPQGAAVQGKGLESDAYWAAASDDTLLVRYCLDCDAPHHYPRNHCPFCFSTRLEDRATTGGGEIYSYSVVRIGPEAPYVLAYVTIDEGVTILTNIVDSDIDAIAIGDRVELAFIDSATQPAARIPVWRRATAPRAGTNS